MPPHAPPTDDAPPPGTGDDPQAEGMPGRISAVYADRCAVWHEGGETICTLRGRLKEGGTPVVGDRVRWIANPDGSGTVVAIEPRSGVLTRSVADRKRAARPSEPQALAANVDHVVVVASLRRPPLRPGLLDRFLAAATHAGIAPVLCITKLDLDRGGEFARVQATYAGVGIPVLGTALGDAASIAALADRLRGRTSVLVGHSGVGKTSLLNALAGLEMTVGDVGFHRDRGRHTTSTARLIPLRHGGFAIDSPGIREYGLHGVEPAALPALYPEFAPHLGQCRFADCLHDSEPDCAVRAAVEAGTIHPDRYAGYRKLLEEAIRRAQAAGPG